MHPFAWMAPGELRVLAEGELEDAKSCVAG
jgi:hypothetical protein